MENAAFESPLSDEELMELGRLVVNCGFVEFLLGFHVSKLLQSGSTAKRQLIDHLATRRKIDILKSGLKTIPKPETRDLVEKACILADPSVRP